MKDLCRTRVTAGAEELGLPYEIFKKGLKKSDVLLNNKVLADLAIWEPRSFKALTQFAWSRAAEQGLNGVQDNGKDVPDNVVTRGMLKKKTT